ncbi:MAG: Rieske 2Fe-2S domain-containing protein [Pseudomonadota bacterium]
MNKELPGQALCRIEELRDGAAISRDVTVGTRELSLLVLADKGEVRVYLNSCPHTGIRLEWRPDDFMDASGDYLQCAMHGALFQPADGRCVSGPCVDESLISVEAKVIEGQVILVNAVDIPDTARMTNPRGN